MSATTTITIRNLDKEVKQRLRVMAAQHGKSMEAEARDILTRAAFNVTRAPEQAGDLSMEGYRSPARGKWKNLGITTDEIMTLTRGY
jgi:plasmid stability protein